MMKQANEFAMDLWRDMCNLPPKKASQVHLLPSIEKLRKTEWSPEFETLMRNRLVMGAFRYETFEDKKQANYDFLGSLFDRYECYVTSGNTEHLIDMANMCLLEFEFGKHPNKHFQALDDTTHTKQKGE